MRQTMLHRVIVVLLAAALCSGTARAAGETATLDGSSWQVAPLAEVSAAGEAISTPGYSAGGWVRAQVPGTVFGSYVNDRLEQEPTYGDNAYKVNRAKYDRDFWYRTRFAVPASFQSGKIWLNFGGVNRDADIYVNGRKVGSLLGFMQRGRFDVTGLVHPGGGNVLAVLDHLPILKDGQVNSSSPSFICSQGWDWMPRVPGLNMGIYKDVFLSRTGPVSIVDPWMRTDALPRRALARLSFQTDLQNSSAKTISGVLAGVIEPGHRLFTLPVSLAAGQTRTVTLTSADAPALTVAHPRLWWPNGYGAPNLYSCRLIFKVGAQASDAKTITFGIRKYTYDTNGGVLHFHVNGVPVFPKGGSWGMAEFMLRCHGADYDTKLRFHQDMHFNMIRNWMGMTPDEAFYAACDKYGIMVWDEFWLNSGGSVPADQNVYIANVVEKIKAFRDHPCIAIWCAENEGTPPEPLNSNIRDAIQSYDHGDRYYQPNSHAGNLSGSGPWRDFAPQQYFIGVGGDANNPYGMRSELGTATFVNFDSFKKFIPQADWWPRNDMWNKHFFGSSAGNAGPDGYYADVNSRYGPSGNIQEFCEKAQMLNLETMKALFEGWLDHSDTDASGVLIWMSQSAYPSMVWQTYDYYYDTTGAYWGARSACEPVHIYWNEHTNEIRVVNTSGRDADGLKAEAWIFNLDGVQKWHKAAPVGSHFGKVADCFPLTFPDDLSPTQFVRLRLTDGAGKIVSENFYWCGTSYLDYTALDTMKPVSLAVASHLARAGNMETITATVTNPAHSRTVALAIRPLVVDARTGAQILPTFMSDGYFSLLPGETKRLTAQFSASDAAGRQPKFIVECWNNVPKTPRPTRSATGNQALYQPVTTSSIDGSASGPSAVVDGDPTTRWSSAWGADPQWIRVDLGHTEDISRVRLLWETAYASAYDIQVSNDDKTWTDIYQTTTGHGGTEDITGLHGRGRYIRLYMTKRATMWGDSLYELEVYGPNAPGEQKK